MHVTILTICYPPGHISGAKLIFDLATEMSKQGNEVTVVTVDDALRTAIEVSKENNVMVVRVRSGKIRHSSMIVRTINEIRLSGIIWNSARDFFKTHPCDLVVCYSPTIFWSGLVNKLKALHGCRNYLVMRDLFPQWALDAGLLSRYGLAYWYFRCQELRLYRSADVIGVQSPANLDYFSRPSIRGRYNVEVLFNWSNCMGTTRRASTFGVRSKFGLQDKVIFMYGGNLGIAQDMDNILRLAINLRDENNIFFLLVGDGSESGKIKQEIAQRGMSNIALHPAVSQEEYVGLLSECDVGLITLRRDLKTHNFPGKMLSYMEQRKPMLASINPGNDLGAIIRDYDAGLVCNNGEDEAFRQHALKLASDPDLRKRMGEHGYALLKEKFDVSTAARQILAHFSLPKISA